MIQKRIAIVTSAQPESSKWWWRGDILNSHCLVSLKNPTWMITDIIDHQQPGQDHQQQFGAGEDRHPGEHPTERSEPVSPMKIFAGAAFHHRNPKQAPGQRGGDHGEVDGSRT